MLTKNTKKCEVNNKVLLIVGMMAIVVTNDHQICVTIILRLNSKKSS